jgi:hypothetical protein
MKSKRFLKGPDVDERYGIDNRTRRNWIEAGLLPPPMVINGNMYFDEDLLEEFERKQTVTPTTPWKDRLGKLRRGISKSTEPTPPDAA